MNYYLLYILLLLTQQPKSIYLYFKAVSQYCSKRESLSPEKRVSNQIFYEFGLNRADEYEHEYSSSFNFIQLVINPNHEDDKLLSKFKGNMIHKHIEVLSAIDYKDPDWFITNDCEAIYNKFDEFDIFYIFEDQPTCKDSVLIRRVIYDKIQIE